MDSIVLHLTRCLRVLRDAAASQLTKHLSTNSDTCVRAHTRTAVVGLYPTDAGSQLLLLAIFKIFKIFDEYHPSNAFFEDDWAIKACEMNNDAIILSAKMATYIGLPLSWWIEPSGSRVYSGRTQCERALVRASVKLSGYRFNTRKPETCFLAQNSHFLLCSFANFLFDIFVGDFKKFGYYSIWIRCIKLCYQFCQTMSGNWSKSKSH